MSISYDIELANSVSRMEIFQALDYCQFEFAHQYDIEKSGVIGYFKDSGMRILYSDRAMADWYDSLPGAQPLTESEMIDGWEVEARISFLYRNSFSEQCISNIKNFVSRLDEVTSCDFILSFEYGVVYAIKKGGLLKWIMSFDTKEY